MAALYRGDELYYFNYVGGSTKLDVHSLKNVVTNTPSLLRTYQSNSCSMTASQQRLAILQNTLYMICSKGVIQDTFTSFRLHYCLTRFGACHFVPPSFKWNINSYYFYSFPQFNEPLSTLAIIKDVTNANSKFENGVPITTTVVETNYFIPIGSSNNTAIGGRPIALIQDKQSYRESKLQYSMALAAPALGSLEGPSDVIIPEKFGYEPASKTYSSYPRPTGGSGSGSGGHSTGDDVAAVAVALPLKMKLLIAAGAILVGGGVILLLMKCWAGCYMVSKDVINGEVPSGAVTIDNLAVPAKKEEKITGSGVGDRAYPVMAEHQASTSSPYGAPLSPAVAQDNGLGYLFTDTSANATQQSTILTIHETGVAASSTAPVLGSPPSPTIPRHSRPDA